MMVGRQTMDAAECAERIRVSKRVTALSGAGLSTSAGIPDFRGPNGLYVTRRYDPETVFDIQAFRRDPKPFYDFTRDFLGTVHSLDPTPTHRFLADLENRGKVTAVVTQNIDSLHQKAGSQNVVSLHGDYWTSHCLSCNAEFDLEYMEQAVNQRGRAALPVQRSDQTRCGVLWGTRLCPRTGFRAGCGFRFSPGARFVSQCLSRRVVPEHAGGCVLVVNQGEVGLPAAANRFFVDEDLDGYFLRVAASLRAGR